MTSFLHSTQRRPAALDWTLRAVVAAGLTVDAVVHLRLASNYQLAFPQGIGGGNLFRIEAAVATIAAIYVLVRGSRRSYLVAFAVAMTAFAAVVLTRYVEVPSFGPLPSMYEPLWYGEKTLSAAAEGIAALAAALGAAIARRPAARADSEPTSSGRARSAS